MRDLARKALAAITGKVDWNAKFGLSYYDFLTNPEEHLDKVWCMMDESCFTKVRDPRQESRIRARASSMKLVLTGGLGWWTC